MDLKQQSIKDFGKWKETIKEKWDEQRKQVIVEGNGSIIYPTTTPQYSTSQTHIPFVSPPTHGSVERKHNPGTEAVENLLKINGLTIASLSAFIVISFIIVRICRRRLNNEKKRKCMGRPLKREDTYHIYAEVEPLTKHDTESLSTNFEAVPLSTALQMRWSGVRSVSDRLLGTNSGRSKTNDSIFFSKQAQSVQFPPLPPVPDFPNRDRRGTMRVERQKVSSAPCPLMDWQMPSTPSNVLVEKYERENVYKPLNREADPAPYDHLKLGKTGSGAHITDKGSPGTPHDYFVLEKEKGGNPQHEHNNSHPYFILEKEEDSLDKDYPSFPTELEGVDEGDCNIKSAAITSIRPEELCESEKDHGDFVLESTASSVSLKHGNGLKTPFEDNHGHTSEKSSSQHHMNTESSRASFEISKNVLNLDDNQNNSDTKTLSTQSSSHLDKTRNGIRQSNDIQNDIWTESTEHSVDNYNDETSKGFIFAVNRSTFDHYTDHKDCNVCGSNVDTAKENTSSSDYIEPIKSKSFSDSLMDSAKEHTQLK